MNETEGGKNMPMLPDSIMSKINKSKTGLGKTGITPLGLIMILLMLVVPVIVQNEFVVRLLVSALMMGVLAMGFDFTNGYINCINFGYAAFWGLGAYTSTLLALKMGLSPWIGMFVGAVVAGILGFIVGVLTLRLAGIFASCMTWFVALALMNVTTNWTGLTNGASGLMSPPLLNTVSNVPYYYLILLILLVVYILLMVITKSKIGLAFKAIGQDQQAAQASGINITYYKVLNMTISCAIAGFVGAFYAHNIGIITPNIMLTSKTVEILAVSYLGGRGTIWGAILAALIIVPGMSYFESLMQLKMVLYGVLLILVMLYYPAGLAGMLRSALKLLQKKGIVKTKAVEDVSK
jgi:branched-chain amino acid transport system permease protein